MRRALAVAAKAPQPGKVKTRLQPLLSLEEATELYRCFLRDTAALMEAVPDADIFFSYTPEGTENLFKDLASNGHRLIPQRGDDFGKKLFYALADLLASGYGSAVIMDADSPTLPPEYLNRAFAELERPGDRTVLGPTTDGGYYLIGLKAPHRALFEGITWSTDRVLAQTIGRAKEINLEVSLLPEWFDVDNAADLRRLWSEFALQPTAGRSVDVASRYTASQAAARLSRPAFRATHTRLFLSALWPSGMPEPEPGEED